MKLTERDERLLAGERGEGAALAMRIVVGVGRATGAEELLDVAGAHVDGCLYHGQASLDFADRLARSGATVSVPTTLNVGSLDLLHPGLYRGDPETARKARRLMDAYVEMGCEPTWTCAPYQLTANRPSAGEHVAWAESNAIVFANSVLGARTERYGDFIDVSAAIAGRVPASGLHLDGNRRARVLFDLSGLPARLLEHDVLYPVLGYLVGRHSGGDVPALVGLPADSASEDRLKALGAAAASSGSVALFHAVGITPEAPSLDEALAGGEPARSVEVTPEMVRQARDALTTTESKRLAAVSLGTPHFSLGEFAELVPLLEEGGRIHPEVDLYVSTSRGVLADVEERGWLEALERAGAQVVVDTCTYVTPILRRKDGPVMTNSAKWAHYAPANVGVEVVFGSLEECVLSAISGEVRRDGRLWQDL
jgi:predicted aconitase